MSWEGSTAGKAYSEFNHHLTGFFILLIAFSEMPLRWIKERQPARLLLPMALLATGVFLLVWSDHEAWPIGPMTFADTFFGDDWEIVQHKLYGVLALGIGITEALVRTGRLNGVAWRIPLPLFAIVGGSMLFFHSHGDHPGAHQIALHHAAMGTMALSAGGSKLFSTWGSTDATTRWQWIWAALILFIGLDLLIYSE